MSSKTQFPSPSLKPNFNSPPDVETQKTWGKVPLTVDTKSTIETLRKEEKKQEPVKSSVPPQRTGLIGIIFSVCNWAFEKFTTTLSWIFSPVTWTYGKIKGLFVPAPKPVDGKKVEIQKQELKLFTQDPSEEEEVVIDSKRGELFAATTLRRSSSGTVLSKIEEVNHEGGLFDSYWDLPVRKGSPDVMEIESPKAEIKAKETVGDDASKVNKMDEKNDIFDDALDALDELDNKNNNDKNSPRSVKSYEGIKSSAIKDEEWSKLSIGVQIAALINEGENTIPLPFGDGVVVGADKKQYEIALAVALESMGKPVRLICSGDWKAHPDLIHVLSESGKFAKPFKANGGNPLCIATVKTEEEAKKFPMPNGKMIVAIQVTG